MLDKLDVLGEQQGHMYVLTRLIVFYKDTFHRHTLWLHLDFMKAYAVGF